MARKWKVGDIFKSLMGGRSENEPPPETEPEGEEGIAPEEQSEEEAPIISIEVLDEIRVQGALRELWQEWSEDSPPDISLLGGKTAEELHLTPQRMEQEHQRLSTQLEEDAKKRLKTIAQAREKAKQEFQKEQERLAKLREEAGAQDSAQEPAQLQQPSLDAVCRVYVSKDKLNAWSIAFPPIGDGKELAGDTIGSVLEKSGVTVGIDSQIVADYFKKPSYFQMFPIAVGTPVIEGEDGKVTDRFARTVSKEVKMDENGIADYRAMSYAQMVHKGDVICDIIPPKAGTAGMRLDGKAIEPKAVHAAKAPSGVNTVLSEDGLQLLAAMDGHLEYVNGAFQVRSLLEITGDVDYSTGNIDFPGDVHITGDVRENFVVRATGSITVDGIVEAATVESGGDLTITRGVVGDNRAFLKSRGCVRAKYLESCEIYAAKSVFADCIMGSRIFSDESINVIGGRGSIVGGSLTAAVSIKANMIGAQSGRRTELCLGEMAFTQHELQSMAEKTEKMEAEETELEAECSRLESAGNAGEAARSRSRLSVLRLKMRKLAAKREQLEQVSADISKCKLESGIIYPVTVLTMRSQSWSDNHIRRQCKLVFDTQINEIKELMI